MAISPANRSSEQSECGRIKSPGIDPVLEVHLPQCAPTRSAVIVCPGGGYETHSAIEADPVAQWLCRCGILSFVLRYRLAPHRYPAMYDDVSRAIRAVRTNSDEYEIDSDRIGVIGFSAGGHLAGLSATIHDSGDSGSDDPVARASSRPDFALLIYPVITLVEPHRNAGSARALLGDSADPSLATYLSVHNRVDRFTPPTFLVHSADDDPVPVQNSLMMAGALAASGVPFELHVFETGGHGYGVAQDGSGPSAWTDLCVAWMKRHGFVP